MDEKQPDIIFFDHCPNSIGWFIWGERDCPSCPRGLVYTVCLSTGRYQVQKRLGQLDALNTSVLYTKRLLEYNSQTNYADVLTPGQNLLFSGMKGIMDVPERKVSIINLYKGTGRCTESYGRR